MASGMDKAVDSTQELVHLADALVNAPEDELQRWADDQPLGHLRSYPERLRDAGDLLDRQAQLVRTLATRVQDVMGAASRGYLLNQEPMAADHRAEYDGPGPALNPRLARVDR